MENLKQRYRTENIPTLIAFLLFALIVIGVLEHHFVLTHEVIYKGVASRFGGLGEQKLLTMTHQQQAVLLFKYPIYTVLLAISIFFYAVCIQPFVPAAGYRCKAPLASIIRVLLISHLATIALLLSKVLYHMLFVNDVDSHAYEWFYPLSAGALVGHLSWPRWAVQLLNNLNLYEFWFTASLGYGLGVAFDNRRAAWVGVVANVVITIVFSLFAGALR
jgi:hypothetical protein